MALALAAIMLEFNQVNTQARTIQECADTLSDIDGRLQNLMASLNQGWQGEAANEYLQKCETLSSMIRKTAQELKAVSDAVRQAAKTYKTAEENALALAQTRMYSGGGGGGGGGGIGGR